MWVILVCVACSIFLSASVVFAVLFASSKRKAKRYQVQDGDDLQNVEHEIDESIEAARSKREFLNDIVMRNQNPLGAYLRGAATHELEALPSRHPRPLFEKEPFEFCGKSYDYYIEIWAGLGDCIRTMHACGIWAFLEDVEKGARILGIVSSHCPASVDLFTKHPRAAQIDVLSFGYEDRLLSKHSQLQPLVACHRRFRERALTNWFHFQREMEQRKVSLFSVAHPPTDPCAHLTDRSFVVLHASAGLPFRKIPTQLCRKIVKYFNARNIRVVHVGKHTVRGRCPGEPIHTEATPDENLFPSGREGQYVYAVNELGLYTVKHLVGLSMGLVTSDSSPLLFAFHENVPSLTLHPALTGCYRDRFKIEYFTLEMNHKPNLHKRCRFRHFIAAHLSHMISPKTRK